MRDRLARAGWTRTNVLAGSIGILLAVGLFVAFLLFVSRAGH